MVDKALLMKDSDYSGKGQISCGILARGSHDKTLNRCITLAGIYKRVAESLPEIVKKRRDSATGRDSATHVLRNSEGPGIHTGCLK